VPSARAPLWIFGYGSLLFRPGFPHEERRAAVVAGWTRRLDQGSPDHRGTPERLGRVATIVPAAGRAVGGAVYRVAEADEDAVLADLDHREKGGYERLVLTASPLRGGPPITAVTWIASPENPYHLGPAPLAAMLAQIESAVGPSGPNVEYVLRLAEALADLGVPDPHVDEVAAALRASRSRGA
jgi:glutathione-specific gamma-glutamylcyclotransferase